MSLKQNSAIYSLLIVCIGFSFYQYQRQDRLSRQIDAKQMQWQQSHQLQEEKIKTLQQREQELQQNLKSILEAQHELELNFQQINVMQNSDQLLNTQFKHLLQLANQQLQLTNNVEQTLATLQDLSLKLTDMGSQWQSFKQAVDDDIITLRSQPNFNAQSALFLLNNMQQQLPSLEFIQDNSITRKTIPADNLPIWQKLWQGISQELQNLVVVEAIETENLYKHIAPEQKALIKQHMLLMLEQIKIAIQTKNYNEFTHYIKQLQTLYTQIMHPNSLKNKRFIEQLLVLQDVKFADEKALSLKSLQVLQKL